MLDKCLGNFFKEDEKAYLFPLISGWSGSDEQAAYWIQNEEIPTFGGQTALEVCQNNQVKALLQYIRHIEYEGFS